MMCRKLQELLEELKMTNRETYDHSVHVEALVLKMLAAMKKANVLHGSAEEANYICEGALLHDIGKLRVDNDILTKDSHLTPEERENMGLHTVYGYELVKDEITGMEREIVGNICLRHHDRVDQVGKDQEELPLYVQIVSICDVFDALHSDRVYRKGLPYDKTMEMIRNGESGYFDKNLIACLENVTREWKV